MKSVGQILKSARLRQKKTLEEVQRETKIPQKNLIALEKDDYHNLPSMTFVKGIIQAYAKVLGRDEEKLVAIFRRDWQRKENNPLVPPAIDNRLTGRGIFWTPKITFIFIVSLLSFLFLIYLGFQVKRFFSPPFLRVDEPLDNEEIIDKKTIVSGKADKEASVYVQNELINIDSEGNFSFTLNLTTQEKKIEVKAVNRRGKAKIISRKIQVVDKNN